MRVCVCGGCYLTQRVHSKAVAEYPKMHRATKNYLLPKFNNARPWVLCSGKSHTTPFSGILIKLSKRGLLGRRGFRGTGKITSRQWGRGSEVDQWLKMLPARPDSLTMGSHTVEGQNWFPPIILRQPTHTLTHTSTHGFNNKCKTVLFQKRVVGVNRLKPHYMYDGIVRE